jgi:CheY-like chemotaxis protein
MNSPPLILVVEDNEANQLLVSALLAREGFEMVAAGDAEVALRWLQDHTPDLILMDIQLPGQDGLSFARRLKHQTSTSGIRIVAFTAHAMVGDSDQALAAGCSGYISKPIDTRTFGEQVRAHLSSDPHPGSELDKAS